MRDAYPSVRSLSKRVRRKKKRTWNSPQNTFGTAGVAPGARRRRRGDGGSGEARSTSTNGSTAEVPSEEVSRRRSRHALIGGLDWKGAIAPSPFLRRMLSRQQSTPALVSTSGPLARRRRRDRSIPRAVDDAPLQGHECVQQYKVHFRRLVYFVMSRASPLKRKASPSTYRTKADSTVGF